jgi:hypothetical protein
MESSNHRKNDDSNVEQRIIDALNTDDPHFIREDFNGQNGFPYSWANAQDFDRRLVNFSYISKECSLRVFFKVQQVEVHKATDVRKYAVHPDVITADVGAEYFPFIIYSLKGHRYRLEVKNRRETFELPYPMDPETRLVIREPEDEELRFQLSQRVYAVRQLLEVSEERLKYLTTVEVDPRELFNEVKRYFMTHIDQPEWASMLEAVWVFGTYVFDTFEAFPYFYLFGEKGSAKTRILDMFSILGNMGGGAVLINPSPASLFRAIHSLQPTVCIDELQDMEKDEKSDNWKDILNMINSGYKRGGVVARIKPNTFAVEYFNIYCPKAFASTTPPHPVLATRCLQVPIMRSNDKSFAIRDPRSKEYSGVLKQVANELMVWAVDNGSRFVDIDLTNVFNKYKSKFEGAPIRALQIMLPLLAVYEALGLDNEYPEGFDQEGKSIWSTETENLRKAIEYQFDAAVANAIDDTDARVLIALYDIVRRDKSSDPIRAQRIIEEITAHLEDPNEEKYYTPRKIGKILAKYQIPAKKTNGLMFYFYKMPQAKRLAVLADVMVRYSIMEEPDPSEPNLVPKIEEKEELDGFMKRMKEDKEGKVRLC